MKHSIIIILCLFFSTALQSQTPPVITTLEYWFDGNFAQKKQATVTPNQTLVYTDVIDASALPDGVHAYHFRAMDSGGKWCAPNTQMFYKAPLIVPPSGLIAGVEYWIDSDIANRKYIPQSPQKTISLSTLLSVPASTPGLHTFSLRAEDTDGRWSPVISQVYYQAPPVSSGVKNITAYRYWFDDKISASNLINLATPVNPYQMQANITVDATLERDATHTFYIQFKDESGEWSMPNSQDFYYGIIRTWTPDAAHPNDWTYAGNWTPTIVPSPFTKVIIPNSASYPVLQASATVDTIQFKPGAELGRQDLLTYNKAYIALDFSSTGLARNYWHLLSMPIAKVVTGDFSFGGYPYTFLRKFVISPDETNTYQMAGWESFSDNNVELQIGEGFALWVNESNGTAGFSDAGSGTDELISSSPRNYGLGQVNGIIQLPYFEDQATSDAHRIHKYENGKSIFYKMNTSISGFPLVNSPVEYPRGADAYRLVEQSSVNIPVKFGLDGAGYFALVGNPFMSTIDFEKFYTGKGIKRSYQVWTGSGFSAYDPDGISGYINDGPSLNQYISPMQSFFVEKIAGAGEIAPLNFDLNVISATPNSNKSTLRSSSVEDKTLNKLNITASNDNYKVLTYIAKRDYGSDKFSDADSRKIIPGMSNVPEIYTLKDSEKGKVAIGSNIVKSDMLVPLGLATAYEGRLHFTFTGMDKYDSQITFMDLVANKEIDLTGKETYDYSFDYTPKKSGSEVKAEEGRFFILIEKSPTGIKTAVDNTTRVYAENQIIYAVSSASNLIRQLEVYNLQGDLLYTNKSINAIHYTVAMSSALPEICLVRLVTEQGVKSVKLMIK